MEVPHVTLGPSCVPLLDPKQPESLGGMGDDDWTDEWTSWLVEADIQ